MQAVILAAGRGKRMGDLTEKIPKPMLKINNKPILEYKLEALPKEITEVIFIIGYLGEIIRKHFGNFYKGRKISYIIQENLDGSGSAVHLAKNFLRDRFLVMMGDDLYYKKDLEKIIKYDLAILVGEVDDPSQFGIVEVDNDGNLKDIIEKPSNSKNNLANIGVYMLNKKFFDYKIQYVSSGETNLPVTVAKMSDKNKIKIIKAEHWIPIGLPEDLKKAEKFLCVE